jgi:hypothetical protein
VNRAILDSKAIGERSFVPEQAQPAIVAPNSFALAQLN